MKQVTLHIRKRSPRQPVGVILLAGLTLAFCGQLRGVEPYTEADAYRTVLSQGTLKGSVPDVAVDYLENSHVVWKDGKSVYYAKMSRDGGILAKNADGDTVPALFIRSMSSATFTPSIAVDYDGAAHLLAPGPTGLFYAKINPDGSLAFTRGLSVGAFIYNVAEYQGGDIAIDPVRNLPVVGTLLYTSDLTFIGGFPFYRYWESIRVLRLDAAGNVTAVELHSKVGPTLGGPPGTMEPPVIAVDANLTPKNSGICHVVWKAQEPNTVEGPTCQNADGEKSNVQGVGWKKGDWMLQYSNSEKAASLLFNALSLRINWPGDIDPGTYLPVPRVAVDDDDRVHVVWLGRDPCKKAPGYQIRYSRIKWDGHGTGSEGTAMQYGTVENRSIVVSGANGEPERANPDLAVGDGVLHVVWSDGRDNEGETAEGCRVYRALITLATGAVQPGSQTAVSELLNTDALSPRIALRPEKEFLQWTGYENPEDTNFDTTEPDTVVNLRDEAINVTATFKPWPGNKPCPPDPTISLEAGTQGSSIEVPISADDGFGGYSIIWQEENGTAYDIALHRLKYWAGVYGLWTPYKRVSRAWHQDDRNAATSQQNLTTGTVIDEPIRVTDTYRELIRYSNYHEAQGMIADGVTPLIIRMGLPAGEYYLDLAGDEESDNLASYLDLHNLQVYNHANSAFEPCSATGTQLKVPIGPDGVNALEAIMYIKGFDHTDPDIPWPLDKSPVAKIEMKLWKKSVNGEDLDMREGGDPPFATVPFSIVKPPVVLVHGFNGSAETWSKEFKKVLEDRIGPDMIKVPAYGQEKVPVGILADFLTTFKESYPGLYTDLEVLSDQYNSTTEWLDAVKGKLTDLGVIEEEEDSEPDILGTFLSAVKAATYWEKSASAHAPLKTLEKMLALKLYVVEEKLRREDRWAFTRYDVVGHCQGGVLLRMLCSNEDMGRNTTFLSERNYNRGRFRRVVTIGSPHRGSRLTSYWRLYKDVAWEQAQDLAVNNPGALLEPLPLLGAATSLVGGALPYYAERSGYMEPKFDAFVGEIVEINQDMPVHPKAKFHLISTIVNHDSLGVWPIFHQLGLKKGAANGLFETALPPPIIGTDPRYSDGLVEWRSHFGGVDFIDTMNQNMVTYLDEWRAAGDMVVTRSGSDPIDDAAWASHVPPFPVTAIIGEPPGPMTLGDLWDLAVTIGKGDWKALLLQAATGLVQKLAKDSGAQIPVFGTYTCQTNSKIEAMRIRDLLDEEVGEGTSRTFGPFFNYAAGAASGDGNPEGDDFLSNQEAVLKQAIRDSVQILPNPRENGILTPSSRRGVIVTNETMIYELHPPAAFPIKDGTAPEWYVTTVNGVQCDDLGVTLVPDEYDPMAVHITIDPDVYGQVYLHCHYTGVDDRTVVVTPLLIGTYNMGEVIAIYFAYFTPVLTKAESLQMSLEAEYSDGTIGPLYPTADDPIAWTSSDTSILTVDAGGKITSVGPTGTATVTATRGSLNASAAITVAGHSPEVRLISPTGLENLTGGDELVLEAVADDVDGTVTSVTFFAGATLIGDGADAAEPYTVTWTDVPAGEYEVYAVAVDNDGILSTSESRFIQIANRPPTLDSWATPAADQWYGGSVYLSAEASDPDGDDVTVQFEYSLDSADGTDGSWAQCYYPLTAPPYECQWQSYPLEAVDDEVWLRVTATDTSGDSSASLVRRIKVDNSTSGLTFDPHPGDTDVALDVHPTITFDNPITHPDGSEITNGDLAAFLRFSSSMSTVPSTFTINAEKTLITVVPDAILDGVARYTLSLGSQVRDSVADALLPQASCTFSTTYGAPVALAFVGETPGGEAGNVLDASLKVAVVDARGNTVLNSGAPITVQLKTSDRGVPTLVGTTTVNAIDGVAEFSDLRVDVVGNYVFQASSGGLGGADSAESTIRPSALASLEVTLSETTVTAGTPVDVTVTVYDRFGNVKTDYNSTPNFSTSDSRARLPNPYTFYETDYGIHTYRLAFSPGTTGVQWLAAKSSTIESSPADITVTNASPSAPVADTPKNGQYTGLAPTLRLLAYDDPDESSHSGTHWQVATDAGFGSIIWDSSESEAAVTLTMASGVLVENTTYWWRARFKDDSGNAETQWGPWSSPAEFHTGYAFPFTDDFSSDRGWAGLALQQWSIGSAIAGGGEYGSPDPGEDTSLTEDNGILGYRIGGDYEPDADAKVTSPPIDCSNADIVELSFQRWLGVEKNDWAHATIEVSNDAETWYSVWENSGTDLADSEWVQLTYDITPYAAGQPTVFVRFGMGPMTMAYPFCGWNIDDLTVRAGLPDQVSVTLTCPEEGIQVGDAFNVQVHVSENSTEVAGVLGAYFDFDLPQAYAHYVGPYYTRDCMAAPFTTMKSGARYSDHIDELGGMTTETGYGNGTPVLFATIPFYADRAGVARFVMRSAGGMALPQPVGYISEWRIPELVLDINIAPASIEPLAYVTLWGPTAEIPLGNDYEVRVYVHETSSSAAGVLGGVLDVYFDPDLTSCPNFDASTAIQAPYTDIGIVSGTLLESRIDELGGLTTATGHGNGTPKLFAILTFTANALGQATFEVKPGSSGLTLTTPVGQLDFSRIDYGPPKTFTIAPNYHLVVTNGTYQAGNGNYTGGTVVPIQADAPATGMIFDHWDGTEAALGTVADANSAATTVTIQMEDVALTAVYRNLLYDLTVNSGSGDTDQAIYQQEIPIEADDPAIGKVFDQWEGDLAALLNAGDVTHPSATVKMPDGDVTLTAVYRNLLYSLTVNNGAGDRVDAIYGEQIAIAADPNPTGYEFAHWTGNTELLSSDNGISPASNDPTCIVTMSADNATLTAVYRNILYSLTVNGGAGSTVEAEYLQEIPIEANEPVTGMEFDRWTGNTEVLLKAGDETSSAATVTMPPGNVTLTANYRNTQYTLTVNNGVGDTNTAIYQQEIEIAADRPPIGQRFKEWQGDVQYLAGGDITDPNPRVMMPAGNVTLTAVFHNVYRLTVVDGTGTGDYPAGETVDVVATPRANGAEFLEWTHDVATITDATARMTTFVTLAQDAVIVPAFVGDGGAGEYCLVVLNGTGSGRYTAGESVTIMANTSEETFFVQWSGMTDALGDAITDSTVAFVMPEQDIAVRAITGEPVSIDAKSGWNLVSVDRVAGNPASMLEYMDTVDTVWAWGDGFYFDVEQRDGQQVNGIPDWHQQGKLVPGVGYWVFSTIDQTIVLP